MTLLVKMVSRVELGSVHLTVLRSDAKIIKIMTIFLSRSTFAFNTFLVFHKLNTFLLLLCLKVMFIINHLS